MSYRYIGNKSRIASSLGEVIAEHVPPGSRIADLMCGTASMSALFRRFEFAVTASDVMTFAAQHAVVRLLLDRAPAFLGLGIAYEEVLAELNASPGERGLFWREYSPAGAPRAGCAPRRYFTAENAARIDGIRRRLTEWAPRLTVEETALLRHDLVLAANRVANIAGTYGHYRAQLAGGALRSLVLVPSSFNPGDIVGHRVLRGPAETVAAGLRADACYLDPPYMKRQYAANYHILETLARGDEPEPVGVSGLRDWWDQYSDFCSKRKVRSAFLSIFDGMDCDLFFVSYSEDGLLSPDEMARLLLGFGRVERHDIPHQRFKSNRGGSGGKVMEHLYLIDRR